MRLNKFIALSTGSSRRAADALIGAGRVKLNGETAKFGDTVGVSDEVMLDGEVLTPAEHRLVMLNKPVGYVCSRDGQGSKTVYDLLPEELHNLKPVGRLDKDSSGLLLLTNDGQLAQELTHPSFAKEKVYDIRLDKPLADQDRANIEVGVELEDGISRLRLSRLGSETDWQVIMSEGRNRQIRRTFAHLGYGLKKLHRIKFGGYDLADLPEARFKEVN